jgi:SAM-dependent methyltransferase
MDFNKTKDLYRDIIEQAIAFSGKGLDFFTLVKADFINKTIKHHLSDLDKPRILDVGCGHGYVHSKLRSMKYEIVGVEMAKEVLPFAKKENPEVSYVAYNGKNLPFADSSFDLTLAICVMHHTPPKQWLNFLREMRRVLRRGGIAVIFEHNPFNPLTRYVVANNEIDADAVLLSECALRGLLLNAQFVKVQARYILFTSIANRTFRKIEERLGWLPLGAQYYVVGKAD